MCTTFEYVLLQLLINSRLIEEAVRAVVLVTLDGFSLCCRSRSSPVAASLSPGAPSLPCYSVKKYKV